MNADILDKIIALATPHRTAAEILDLSLAMVLSWFDEAIGAAYLVQGEMVRLAAQRGLSAQGLAQPFLPLEGLGLGSDCHKAKIFTSSALSRFGLVQAIGEHEIQSLVLLPLDGQKKRGFLLIGVPHPMVLTKARYRLLTTVGYTVGLAVRSVDSSPGAGSGDTREQAILDMCRTLVSAPDLDSVLKLIVYTAVQGTEGATSGAMYFFGYDDEELVSGLADATGSAEVGGQESRLVTWGRRVAQEALDGHRVVHVPDLARDDRFADAVPRSQHDSVLVAPLQVPEHSIGVLILESNKPYAFSQADESFAMSLATTAAEAIERKRLGIHQDALAREWNHLVCLDLCHLLQGIAHDLRNPLTAVIGYAQLLQVADEAGNMSLRDLDKIQNQAQKAAKIVNDLSGFARYCGASSTRANVNELLRHMLALCSYSLEADNIVLDTDLVSPDPYVEMEPGRLQQIFLRFLSHVRDTWSRAKSGQLCVITKRDASKARILWAYGQLPLPTSFAAKAEELANEAMDIPDGLSLCTTMVQECGGSMHYVDSGNGTGAWIVELPLSPEAEITQDLYQSLRKRSST